MISTPANQGPVTAMELSEATKARFAREVANHVVFMDEGVIVEQGTPEAIFERAQSPRTKDFLAKVL